MLADQIPMILFDTQYANEHYSILGPLLFNTFNDLPSVPKNCSSQCYVDDTKLLMSFQLHDQHAAISKMNKDLLSIRNWCFDNQLLLNPLR